MRRLRATIRRQRQRDDGRHVLGFGLRFGYWPCLHAPFVRLDFGPFIAEVWHGEKAMGFWA